MQAIEPECAEHGGWHLSKQLVIFLYGHLRELLPMKVKLQEQSDSRIALEAV